MISIKNYNTLCFEYHKDTIAKLNSIFMFKELKKYVEVPSLITIDLYDFNDLFIDKDIILTMQKTYRLDNFHFTSKISDNSYLFVGIDGNKNLDLKTVDTIIDEIKRNCNNVRVLYATNYDDTFCDGSFKLNIINTIEIQNSNQNNNIEMVIEPEKNIQVTYKLEEIYKSCKEVDDFSINYIQSLTDVGFVECSKIHQILLKMKTGD